MNAHTNRRTHRTLAAEHRLLGEISLLVTICRLNLNEHECRLCVNHFERETEASTQTNARVYECVANRLIGSFFFSIFFCAKRVGHQKQNKNKNKENEHHPPS